MRFEIDMYLKKQAGYGSVNDVVRGRSLLTQSISDGEPNVAKYLLYTSVYND